MQNGIIEKFSIETLKKYGLDDKDQRIIKVLMDTARYDNLYSSSEENNHNIYHIERIIAYTIMLMKKIKNTEIDGRSLLLAALYHDIGNKEEQNSNHGAIAAVEFMNRKRNKMDEKMLKTTSLLIAMHSEENEKVEIKDRSFTDEDKENIQLMLNILKDANALDRNRETCTEKCDPNKLRTFAAKELLNIADSFYEDYNNYYLQYKEANKAL